ncbi:MAG: hypothetical protein AAF936_14570 [Pseudomonadota bacterium]
MRKFLMICATFMPLCSPVYAEKVEYEYDAHGRLVKVVRCGADTICDSADSRAGDDTMTEYKYDKADNRTEKEVAVPPP